jgi:predicted ATPase/DNA-binding SARP family transcriptional activator
MLFGVLGPVAVWTDAGEPVPVAGLKVRALLAILLAHEGRPVSAARLIDGLWGEDPPGDPAGTLSGKVTQLRRALEQGEPGGRRLVLSPPPGYGLRIGPEAVDAGRFRALAARARAIADGRARAGLLGEALALWRGPAFAGHADEPSVRTAAARLEEERLAALEDRAETQLALGEHAALISELTGLLAAHPLRERLRAVQLRALYRAGRPAEALDSYAAFRAHLAEELGLDPGPELAALQVAILRRDPALHAPAPWTPPRPGRARTNLPAALSELIGRDEAVTGIRARLERSRLVTLTGPGGVGKTRLALAAAGPLAEVFDDGAWLAELATLEPGSAGEPADVVMSALDVRDEPGCPRKPADRLADALRDRQLLLVLDNCEHLIERAAELAGRLLGACPGLRILATSRAPLGVPGEVIWTVPPLEVPGPAAGPDPAEIARSPAVRLFAERAAAAAPGFALAADTAGAVAVLCRRLDGIPLALELAATRVRALGVHELVARVDDRFRLLGTGLRGAPARQQTLAAVIDWSWDLLTGAERAVLRRLAGHADGCTLAAAEAVCAGGAVPAADVAGLLGRLVDHSLVTVTHGADGPRYRLLESVAAYCAARLAEAGEADGVRDRHGHYYTELAGRTEPALFGPEQRRWLRRLDAESANLRSAQEAAVRDGRAERALRLAVTLTWYWFLRGRLAEARRSLRAALAAAGPAADGLRARAAAWHGGIGILLGEPPDPAADRACEQLDDRAAQGRAEWFLAYALTDLGQVAAVDERLERALAAAREAGDRWGTAAALSTRAKLGYVRGDLKALEADGEQSAALFGELGDRWGLLQATAWLGGLAEMTGDHVRATRLHRDGLRMAEELGLWSEVSTRLAWLGWIALQQCDYPQARDLSGQALALAGAHGFRAGEAFAEIGVAFAARRQNDLEVADRHLSSLLRSAGPQEEGQPPPLHLPLVLTELGFLAEQRGRAGEAARLHCRALEAARTLGQPRAVALALEGLAGAAGLSGDYALSARLLGASGSARHGASTPPAPSEQAEIDRITAAARAALGDAAFAAACQQGAAQTPEDATASYPTRPTS